MRTKSLYELNSLSETLEDIKAWLSLTSTFSPAALPENFASQQKNYF